MTALPYGTEAYNLMHDGILALGRIERQGIRVDVDFMKEKMYHLERKKIRAEEKFKQTDFYKEWQKSSKTEININSSDQLSKFLYDVKGIKIEKQTASGKGSTDKEAIKNLDIPELTSFHEEKNQIKKALDVLTGFMRDQTGGYIHPFFNLHTVQTYRGSSDSPNFQNIPIRDEELMKICRRAIIPRAGHQLLEIDFGQLEVRISACYNKDQKLIHDILHGDMHADMAAEIFMIDDIYAKLESKDKVTRDGHKTLRKGAKNAFVFPQFYGDYYKKNAVGLASNWGKLPKTGKWKTGQGIIIDEIGAPFKPYYLSDHLISKGIKELGKSEKNPATGKWEVTGFTKHIKDIEDSFWNERYYQYRDWKENFWEEYQKKGYFDLYTGFRCSGVMRRNEVVNYPVQGSAFHCLLWSLIQSDKLMLHENWDTRLIGQIHDSLILDVHPKELDYVAEKIQRITTIELPKHWDWIQIPLEVDAEVSPVDAAWMYKEKYKLN